MGSCCDKDKYLKEEIKVSTQNNDELKHFSSKKTFSPIIKQNLPKKSRTTALCFFDKGKSLNKLINNSGSRQTAQFLLQNEGKQGQTVDKLSDEQKTFIKSVLNSYQLFMDLSDETFNDLVQGFFCSFITDDYVVYFQGDESKVLYIVEEGEVQLTDSTNNETTKCFSKEIFGIEALEQNVPRSRLATASKNTKLLCISGEFIQSVYQYHQLKVLSYVLLCLKNYPFFRMFSDKQLMQIAQEVTFNEYAKNKIILFEKNEEIQKVYIIEKGLIKVTKNLYSINELKEGSIFGHVQLFYFESTSNYTYSTGNQVTLIEIPLSVIRLLIKEIGDNNYLYLIYKNLIRNSSIFNKFLAQYEKELFPLFKLKKYRRKETVYNYINDENKNICIILSGHLINNKTNECVSKKEEIFGESIINSINNLDYNLIASEEMIVLEAQWADLKNESMKYCKVNIDETMGFLKEIPALVQMKEIQLFQIAKKVQIKKFSADDKIITEGHLGNSLYIVQKGKVHLYKDNVFVRELESKGIFGVLPKGSKAFYNLTAKSIGECKCIKLGKAHMKNIDKEVKTQILEALSLQNSSVKINSLKYIKSLGCGNFGSVCLVHNDKYLYAIKYVPISTLTENEKMVQYCFNEKNIMIKTDNPFIIKLVKTFKNEDYLFYLLEYVDGISLRNHLETRNCSSFRKKEEVVFYGAILLSAINYLHQKRIIHRDIKPENCMIDRNGYLKVIDFGISKYLTTQDSTKTICGTYYYLSPEILIGNGYSFSSDYWSVGITLFEIFYGFYPFGQGCLNPKDIFREILHKKIVFPSEPGFKDINSFFRMLLSRNSIERAWNFTLLQAHPFFSNFNFEKLFQFSIKAPYIPSDITINSNQTTIPSDILPQYSQKFISIIKNKQRSRKDLGNTIDTNPETKKRIDQLLEDF